MREEKRKLEEDRLRAAEAEKEKSKMDISEVLKQMELERKKMEEERRKIEEEKRLYAGRERMG